TYNVTDINSLTAVEVVRTVNVVDTTKPVITLKGDPIITIEYGKPYVEQGVIVTDNYDKNLTATISSIIDTNTIGTYTVTYTVTDTAGNKQTAIRTVNIIPANFTDRVMESFNCTAGNFCYSDKAGTNNYVWYSGQLWRIVKVNLDGTINMVTDSAISTFPYDDNSNSFTESYMSKWLNDTFYNNLDNANNIIKQDTKWCHETTRDINTKRTDCLDTYKVSSKVGLLSLDDVNIVGGITSYLNNGDSYFTMTPLGTTSLAIITNTQGIISKSVKSNYAVRPTIVLQSNVAIKVGDGTKNNPYKLSSETVVSRNAAIKTRYTGEYVMFAGNLWRVVTQTTAGTRLVLDDAYKTLNNGVAINFGINNFNISSGIGNYLNTTLYNTMFAESKYNNLLLTTKWELKDHNYGVDSHLISNNYLESKVGLLSIGDLMAASNSNFRSTNSTYWTLNNLFNQDAWYISTSSTGEKALSTQNRALRPVIEIKNSLKIKSGDGTITSPIELLDY
ncbi:MAG: DUF5011 domain-containing protein, partial [Bacilli bacterium]